jgi:hypothetical protein
LGSPAEVESHVREHLPDDWIALDDDPWDWSPHSLPHLVLCNGSKGLGDPATLIQLRKLLVTGGTDG